mgnify:CR=1 FL=1
MKRWKEDQKEAPTDQQENPLRKEAQLMKLIRTGNEFIENEKAEIDYQKLVDDIRMLTGARYAACNLLDEDGEGFTTVSLSGKQEDIQAAASLLGENLTGKKWQQDPTKNEIIKHQTITVMPSLSALTAGVMPVDLIQEIEEQFQLGQVVIIKILKKNQLLGDFTLMMDREDVFDAQETAAIFASQVGLFLEKQRAQETLLINKDKYEVAMDATDTGLWEWDLKRNQVKYSAKWKQMLGLSEDEVSDTVDAWKALWHPDDAAEIEKAMEEYQQGKSDNYEIVHRLRHRNGQWRWILTRGMLIRDAANRPAYWIGTNTDVTEMREAQEALEQEKRRLTNILEATNAGTWEWNIQTGKMSFNEQMATMLGYTTEDFAVDTIEKWNRLVHPEDLAVENANIQKVFQQQEPYYMAESRVRTRQGSWIWVQDRGKVIAWTEDGNPLLMYGTIMEITDRKHMEQAMKESEENYRVLVESSYDIIYRISTKGLFTYLSPAWHRLLGHSVEEAIGKSFQPYVHPEDLDKVEDFFHRIRQEQSRQEILEYRLKHVDGAWHWFTTNAEAILGTAGEVVGYAGTARDITEVKNSHLALEREKKELERFFSVNLDLLCIADVTGRLIKLNRTWEKTLGFSVEELLQKNMMELIHPEDRAPTTEALSQLEDQQEVLNFINRYRCADGS